MKDVRDSKWYHRGREARKDGKPRDLKDGRFTAENRAAWYEGWDAEARLRMAAAATPEQLAESRRVVGNLKAWALENLK